MCSKLVSAVVIVMYCECFARTLQSLSSENKKTLTTHVILCNSSYFNSTKNRLKPNDA